MLSYSFMHVNNWLQLVSVVTEKDNTSTSCIYTF